MYPLTMSTEKEPWPNLRLNDDQSAQPFPYNFQDANSTTGQSIGQNELLSQRIQIQGLNGVPTNSYNVSSNQNTTQNILSSRENSTNIEQNNFHLPNNQTSVITSQNFRQNYGYSIPYGQSDRNDFNRINYPTSFDNSQNFMHRFPISEEKQIPLELV